MTRAERQLIALEKGLRNVRKLMTTMIREISPKSRHAVKAAGYDHAFVESDGKIVIDMNGIALSQKV